MGCNLHVALVRAHIKNHENTQMLTAHAAFVVGWLQLLTVALTFKAAFGLN
jgi:hypothetical protein